MADQTVPSWDDSFPAKQQAAQLDVANNQMPDPMIPASQKRAQAAQSSPPAPVTNAQDPQASAGVATPESADDTPKWEDSKPVEDGTPKWEDSTPPPPIYQPPPNNSAMRSYVDGNVQVYNAANADRPAQPEQHPADSMLEALESGLQMSTAGLGIRGKMPNVVLPENASRAYRIANQIGTLAGDMPAMLAGGIFGGLAGGAEGATVGSVVPGLGTAIGGVGLGAMGASAGAFAVPAAIRKMMIDHYTNGDIQTAGEFTDRLMATTWEATKGAITGGATALTGGLTAVSGPMLKIGAELATMTTVGAALEGHLPHAQDFIDGAIVIGGLHGMPLVKEKLQNIFAKTGERPEQVVAAANGNPELKQQLLSADKESPVQSSPTDLKRVPIEPEGEPVEGKQVETEHQLVPQDLSVKPPEDKTERSPEEQEILSKIGEQAEKTTSFKDRFNEFYAKNVDWTDPLKSAYAAWKLMTGKELTAEENPHIQARLFAGHMDLLRRILSDGVPDEDGNFKSGGGLNDIYKRVPDDNQAGFDAYSMAKRAIELDDRGMVPWKDFSRENAEKVVSDGSEKYEDLHQERVKAMNDVMDYGVRKGVIDPGIAQASKEGNQEYLPFNRIIPPDELTGEIGGNGKLIQKIKGSDLELKNPRMSAYENIAAIVRRAEINDVRMGFLENLKLEDEHGFMTNPFVREVPIESKLGANQIAVFREGKMSALEGTPLVIDSLKRLEGDRTAADFVTKMASKFSQAVRVGTVIDPGFGVRHFIRSSIMSGVYSQTGQIPFIHPLMALPEFMGKSSEAFKNFLSDGGASSGLDDVKSSYIDNNLQESDSKVPFLDNAWNVIKHPLEASEAFIKMTDNLSRFTEYKRALEQGSSRDQAAFLAREVTPDFAKVGLQRSALRTAVAFQGAHINSLDRMVQAFREDTQGTLLRMSVLSFISMATWYANKDDKDMEDLPNYQKDLYWNFKVPGMTGGNGSSTIMKIPKPWGPGILFGSGTERTLDTFFKDKPDAYKAFGKSLMDSVIPNIIPTMAAPILDQMANKNLFTGRQLVNTEQQKLLPEMQYQPYTSETAKQLGKLIQAVPGVRDIGPSSDPLASPAVIENYIRGWTGVAGGWAIKIADAGLREAGITPKNTGVASVEEPLAEYPILNEFLTRFPSMKEQPVQDFYENFDKSQKVWASLQLATKRGDQAMVSYIMAQNPNLQPRLQSINETIGFARKAINLTQENPNISPVEKRQLIDGALFQIGSAAKMGNQIMENFNKQLEQAKKTKAQAPGGQ